MHKNVTLFNGQQGVINTDYSTSRGVMDHHKLTESQFMGMLELDALYASGGSPNSVGMYLETIKENWDNALKSASYEASPYMVSKFNEYYNKVKFATQQCAEPTFVNDVNSSQLIKSLTLQSKVVVLSTFIVGLLNDYKKTAFNVRMYACEQATTAIYLSSNQVFEKIKQGRFNELTVEDMNRMESVVYTTNNALEQQLLLTFYGEMLSYVTSHYANAMQTLQNLAHMPSEDGTGLLAALEKCLWMDNNKGLLYKAKMGELMQEFNQQHPEYVINGPDSVDIATIEAKAATYRYAGMPYEQAWQKASQELALERNRAITDEMSKYHNKFIEQHKISNPNAVGIATEFNVQGIGIQPVSPGVGPVRLGLSSSGPTGMMPQAPMIPQPAYAQPMYAQPTYAQPATVQSAVPTYTTPANTPLFPNGAQNLNNVQSGQQVYNTSNGYINVNSQPQNNGLVNINGVWCKETSPGSGSYVAVNNGPVVPKNSFDIMYPNGFM